MGSFRIPAIVAFIMVELLLFGCFEHQPDPEAVKHNQAGLDKYASGDAYGAIAEFSKAIEIDSKYAEAYKNRAEARYETGNKEAAISDLSLALVANPNYKNASDMLKSYTTCQEGTKNGSCSQDKPLFCVLNDLVNKSSKCGCPSGYRLLGEGCKKITYCLDGTIDGACSKRIPFFCTDQNFTLNASGCGCPSGFAPHIVSENMSVCALTDLSGARNNTFDLWVDGEHREIWITTQGAMDSYLAGLPRNFSAYGNRWQTYEEYEQERISEPMSYPAIMSIISFIKSLTAERDSQARAAISFVQHIPYDDADAASPDASGRYPYEVLYDGTGVCWAKSELLANMLGQLGYGVALFSFDKENHLAVGIKCPMKYSYKNTGYCFVESTTPKMITDGGGNYTLNYTSMETGPITSMPAVLNITDGSSMDSVAQDYIDLAEYKQLLSAWLEGDTDNTSDYTRLLGLRSTYGLESTTCDENSTLCNGLCYGTCDSIYREECVKGEGYSCQHTARSCPKTFCNGICYGGCTGGQRFACNGNSAYCEETAASCAGTFCNGECYVSDYCPHGYAEDCPSSGELECQITSSACPGRFCNGECWDSCPSGTHASCESEGMWCR